MLGLARDLILLVKDRLSLAIIQPKRGVDLTPPFDGLFVEVVGATLVPVEIRLEMVTHMEEHVDGAAGVGICSQAFSVANRVKMEDGCTRGENPPVHGIGERCLLYTSHFTLTVRAASAREAALLFNCDGAYGL